MVMLYTVDSVAVIRAVVHVNEKQWKEKPEPCPRIHQKSFDTVIPK